MLALLGYSDDSGTHSESEAVTVAGYISTAEQWEIFNREWGEALKEWGLEFFHMTDFANRVGKYAEWTDQERRFRLARLVGITNRHTLASIGTAVPKRAFDQVFSKKAKRFVGGAYGLAATAGFLQVVHILEPDYPSARIAYILEAGTNGSGEILKVFNWNYNDREQRPKLKLMSLKFEGKEFSPLQAADILAYELYRLAPHAIGADVTNRPRTDNLRMLSDCKLTSWIRLEDSELMKWARIIEVAAQHHEPAKKRGNRI